MRYGIAVIVSILALALFACVCLSRRSHKAIAPQVMRLVNSLILPVVGNLIVALSQSRVVSTIGYFMFFLGLDLVLVDLIGFTLAYCRLQWKWPWLKTLVYTLIGFDFIQLLLNPIFRHAFDLRLIQVSGAPYYQMVPLFGQYVHRVICYGIFAASIAIFFYKLIRSPGIYKERYAVIFFSMVVVGGWQTFYVLSLSPIDLSMIGFGGFGLLAYYFALHYRPVRMLDSMLANIASDMNQAIFFFDIIGRCVWVNKLGVELIHIEDDFEVASEGIRQLFPDIDLRARAWQMQRTAQKDGETRYYHMVMQDVRDSKDRVFGSFLTIYDETEQQHILQKEQYAANHDSLTGLFSKDYLYRRVRETIDQNPGATYMVCYLDIKNFKLINDIFGRSFGDYTLQRVADSLRQNMREGFLYGRISGDTFGMCIPKEGFFAEIAEQALHNFIVKRDKIEYHLVLHQGVYEVTERDLDVSIMFDRANMALESIKNEYNRHIAYYDDNMRNKALWDQRITEELGGAIEDGQIQPYLQPIVNADGRVVGAEALVRWLHPTEGLIPPYRFIPVFEKNGMISQLDRHMWRCACQILREWQDKGVEDMFISINISPNDFYFIDVVNELKQIIWDYDVDPSRLRVEITETVMMTDEQNRLGILRDLKNLGFIVEMDDFGSGYSSLNMLKDMPVDVIKIDMLFLRKTEEANRAITILNSIMKLSNDLSIASITEGVETEVQYQILVNMGCQLFQGYYFAKPMPAQAFQSYLEENRGGRRMG